MDKIITAFELKNNFINSAKKIEEYHIDENDIKSVNNIIAEAFKEEWQRNPEAKRTIIANESCDCQACNAGIFRLLNWSYEKYYACGDELLNMLEKAGFIYCVTDRGAIIKIK